MNWHASMATLSCICMYPHFHVYIKHNFLSSSISVYIIYSFKSRITSRLNVRFMYAAGL